MATRNADLFYDIDGRIEKEVQMQFSHIPLIDSYI